MKTKIFTPTALLLSIVMITSACRSSRNTGGSYPGGGSTSGKSYPVFGDPNPNNLPPGQAKKIYGDKSAKKYAPGQRKKQIYPLIIIRTPDIVIGRASDGRNYYLHPDGYYYWEGPDSKFYLDEKYIGKVSYDKNQYNDWKSHGNGNAQSSSNSKGKGNSNGNGNGNGNSHGNSGNGKGKSKN
jgi:hypothetical protein